MHVTYVNVELISQSICLSLLLLVEALHGLLADIKQFSFSVLVLIKNQMNPKFIICFL